MCSTFLAKGSPLRNFPLHRTVAKSLAPLSLFSENVWSTVLDGSIQIQFKLAQSRLFYSPKIVDKALK